jgi:hypothetical protein
MQQLYVANVTERLVIIVHVDAGIRVSTWRDRVAVGIGEPEPSAVQREANHRCGRMREPQ